MYLLVNDPHYSADGYVGDRITLVSDDGEIIATAYTVPNTNRFTVTDDIQPDTILYQSWQAALASVTLFTPSTIDDLPTQETYDV